MLQEIAIGVAGGDSCAQNSGMSRFSAQSFNYFCPVIDLVLSRNGRLVLDLYPTAAYIGLAVFNSAAEIGVSFKLADKPLLSGFFTSVNTIETSFMAGHSGGSYGCVGFQFTETPTLLLTCHPQLALSGGLIKPKLEAFTMPKLARTLLSYSTIIALTLAFERSASVPVILATLATFTLVHLIGGAHHA
jgi:hypothetical protein